MKNDNPTFTRIDRSFGTPDWRLLFPNADLQALSTMGSGHRPLFLPGDVMRQHYTSFSFESYWVNMGFMETAVQAAWDQPVNTQEDAILGMHVKLLRTAKALKLWKRQNHGNLDLRLAIANEVLLLLDTAQEQISLTAEELQFRKYLKAKSVGLDYPHPRYPFSRNFLKQKELQRGTAIPPSFSRSRLLPLDPEGSRGFSILRRPHHGLAAAAAPNSLAPLHGTAADPPSSPPHRPARIATTFLRALLLTIPRRRRGRSRGAPSSNRHHPPPSSRSGRRGLAGFLCSGSGRLGLAAAMEGQGRHELGARP
jgi:hypothetical protein